MSEQQGNKGGHDVKRPHLTGNESIMSEVKVGNRQAVIL